MRKRSWIARAQAWLDQKVNPPQPDFSERFQWNFTMGDYWFSAIPSTRQINVHFKMIKKPYDWSEDEDA